MTTRPETQSASIKRFSGSRKSWFRWHALVVVGSVMLSGCATLSTPGEGSFRLFGNEEAKTVEQPPSQGSYEVLLKPRHGTASKQMANLTGPVTLQQVIEASGAIKKFKNMSVTVYRPVKKSPIPLQMQADFDPAADTVRPEQNYAILDGDKIVMEAKSSASIEKVLSGLTRFDF